MVLPATVDPPRALGAVGYFNCLGGLPVPRQQRVQVVRPGCSRDDAFQHVGQPGQRIDSVQLCRLDQRGDGRPMPPAVIGASEQRILAPRATGRTARSTVLVVQLQAAVVEIKDQPCIAVHLQQAAEPTQVRLRMFALAVLTINEAAAGWPGPHQGRLSTA